ncbi:hypothetical protein BDZ89DRAFT_1169746, partial [Hymenopellis radicata]
MDPELEGLRREILRVKKDRDQVLEERNQYLSQVQHERTSKAELSSKNTELSNTLLARDSEISDLKRTNQDLSEQLELALSVKVEGDRKPTLSRTSTRSPLRATPAKSRGIPRMSVSVEVPIPPKSKASSSRTATAPEPPIVVSDDEEDASIKPKGEASSPIRGEKPAGEDLPPGPSSLEASDNDDPFADDFELLQKDQTLSPPAEEQKERSLSPLSIISSPPSSRATTEFTDLPASSDHSGPKDDEMDVDTTKPQSSKSGLKRKREEEEIAAPAKKASTKKHTSSKASRAMKATDITQYNSVAKLYLSDIPTFTITPPPEPNFFFSRKEFNKAVGGTTFKLLVTVTEWKTAGTVLKRPIHCLWPTRVLNPLTVDGIGAPGLLFAGRQDILNNSPLYVFRSVERDGAKWEYCGNYEAEKIGHLAAEHFRLYPQASKDKWGAKISTSCSKNLRLYLDMRVRIALRKMGEEITPDRVEKEARALIKDK